ncbi:MAG: caspase family protein [Candidatus Accumulibacter sp.]|uniref:WD40 domain-containing protein n=1 Tax=Accumulibacter sp. TaxID=2053492 RepID=UPI00287B5438|nr:caspase family protein [Accumulibacter sp.]MDS4014133.1 caspase family protein [Accumulibacter sp.]
MGLPMWTRDACRRFALGLVLCLVGAVAAEVPTEPILRIEAGAHLSLVTRVSSDSQGRWIVSASEDKTARLWDAASGRLLTVFRPPVGAEGVGALYAAALSPDGRQVALGGNAGFDGRTHSLYLFDRASGRLPPKSTLSGLEAPLTQLAWSKDSQFVAVGLRQSGLRVFQRNLGFVGSDPEYNEAIYGADFAADGRLATCSLDGSVRLYRIDRKGLQRTARKQMPGKPYSVAFSPDGSMLAVGYQDLGRIDVLDAATLSVRHSTASSGEGNLGRVAWNSDGRVLYGAGTARARDRFVVFAFADGGRAAPREITGFSNIVTALAAWRDGVLVGSAEPSWASFDANGSRRLYARQQTADYRDADEKFMLSEDAARVAFPLAPGGSALLFDLAKGDVRPYNPEVKLDPPRQPGWMGGGPSNWKNSSAPKLGSRPLDLRPGEVARSLALSSDKQRFVIGSEWYLRAYTADGNPLWEQRTPAAAWATNVSGDGRWVVAGLGDGTIRWYRMRDGREQLALFVHIDGKRWIIWSPSGYYDTSLEGEDLVGWHLNRGPNVAADFFSVGRFRDRFYRPEIIQSILRTGDEGEAVRATASALAALGVSESDASPAPAAQVSKSQVRPQALAPSAPPPAPASAPPTRGPASVATLLPPVIDLQTDSQLETSASTVPVRFVLRSPSDAPVSELKVRVNDKLVRSLDNRALRSTRGEAHEVQVEVPPLDSQIRLFAANKNGKSEPAVISVRRAAAPVKLPETRFETLYLLIIGVSKYPEEWKLDLAEKDARDFNHHMVRQAGKLYGTAVPRLLINEQASRQNVLDGLRWLRESVGEKDAGVVFMAGHGDRVGAAYYFIPGDPEVLPSRADFKNPQEFENWKQQNAPRRWVPGEEISRTLLGLKGRSAFFIDTCHSGVNARPGQSSTNPDLTKALNEINEERGVLVFASSTGKEYSQEDPAWGNGAFTKAIIEGLRGGADFRKDGLIRPSTLQSYVTDRVIELTKREQRPVIFTVGIDDPIAVKAQ